MAIQGEDKNRLIGKLKKVGQVAYFKNSSGRWTIAFATVEDEVQKITDYVLTSSEMEVVIAEVRVTDYKDGRKRILIEYNKLLLATRPRPDGVVGIQTIFEEDTRLAKDKKDDPSANSHLQSYGFVPIRTDTKLAHWNTKDSLFVMERKKK